MVIKIQGNSVCENDIHHWILVSDDAKGWVDIPFSIDTPKFETLQELVEYLEEKEGLIAELIQGKLDEGIEVRHPNEMCVDRPDLIPEA